MARLIRPLMYFCRRGVSDCDWIIQRMKLIPEDKRREVSNNYENMFIRNVDNLGRKHANEYLDDAASEYKNKLTGRSSGIS